MKRLLLALLTPQHPLMQRHSNTLIASLALLLALLNSPTPASAQAKLTAEDWIEDVRYLQQTVHTDYPHLFDKISAQESIDCPVAVADEQ